MKRVLFLSIFFLTILTNGYCNNYCCRWDCCSDCGCELHQAQPCCDDLGFFSNAELLFWTPYQNDLDYTLTRDSVSAPLPNGKTHNLDYDWTLGYRLSIGYRWGCDGWDVKGCYTYYHNKAKASTSVDDPSDLIPTIVHPFLLDSLEIDFINGGFTAPFIQTVQATSSLKYDVADFLFSRPFFISQTHLFRPFFGVRALWLKNSFNAKYFITFPLGASDTFFDYINSNWQGHFEGAGLHAGIEHHMHICNCFSLYGILAASIIGGESESKISQKLIDTSTDTTLSIPKTKEKSLTALPGLHLGTGFSWEKYICGLCLIFNIGYEFNHWFNTPKTKRFTNSSTLSTEESNTTLRQATLSTGTTTNNTGSLTLHGLTLNLNVYY